MVVSRIYNVNTEANAQASEHFKVKEFACKDGSAIVLIHQYLIDALETIRTAAGNRAITINSGYRTYSHNRKIGGASASYHLYGLAADIVISGMTAEQMAKVASAALGNKGGVGLYNGYIHVDGRVNRYRFDKRTGVEKAVTDF